ncbi:hypothetical protein J4E91_010725 [Alternaria rosae]|nr:hypothetical protein J4E91_010725 [Alternaria rosae]
MSLLGLSTEIDEMIIQYLPQPNLHSLTLTNKYYRKIAELHLYRGIQVRSPNTLSGVRLLLTLINRRELAQHTRSFALVTADEGRARDATNLSNKASDIEARRHSIEIMHEKLFRKSPIMKEVIEKLVNSFRNLQFEVKWYFSVLDATRSIDGSLDPILCLATNLEKLRLMNVQSEITEAVCRARWEERTKSASSRVYPLHKLRNLDVVLGRKASIPIVTPMETLKVSGEGAGNNFQWPRNGYEAVGTLRSLEIRHITLQPDQLHHMLALPEMHGIQHLKMGNVYLREDHTYDFCRLSELLQHFLPSLKTFEWTGEESRQWYPRHHPFGSVTGFKHLKELVLGFKYIRPASGNIYNPLAHLVHPANFFPDSLKTLKITGIPRWFLHELEEASAVSPSHNSILTTGTSLGISTFDLLLDMKV